MSLKYLFLFYLASAEDHCSVNFRNTGVSFKKVTGIITEVSRPAAIVGIPVFEFLMTLIICLKEQSSY